MPIDVILPRQPISSCWRRTVYASMFLPVVICFIYFAKNQPAEAFVTPISKRSTSVTLKTSSTANSRISTSILGPVARNGLQYEDVEIGTGRRVFRGDAVLCYYVGTYQKGTEKVTFDQTEPGEPAEFVVGKGQVIPGWDLGILGDLSLDIPPMKIGGDRKLVVPAALAYGDQEVGPIPANQDLEFQIMVINAQPTGGVSASTQIKGIAGLLAFLSFSAVLGVFIAQNYNGWF